MMLESCIYEGSVRHRRFNPVQNTFRYRLYMIYLDLAELPQVFKDYRLWSIEHVNLAYFRRRDHFGDRRIPLDRAVRDLVEKKLNKRPDGPIRMLTQLRYFGYCFNPATFYYCRDQKNANVETIVVEIHNTPWNQTFCYVLGEALNEHPMGRWKRYQFGKAFHVSPFMEMEIQYDWRFREPGESINVHIINMARGIKRFDATLTLLRKEITGNSLRRVMLVYPFMTMKVVCMIYWQALRLLIKGATFYVHPAKRK